MKVNEVLEGFENNTSWNFFVPEHV